MAHDLQLDLDVLLPDAHDSSDRCVEALVDVLASTSGVDQVHVVPAADGRSAQVCLHLQPGQVSLVTLGDKARAAGASISSTFGHAVWRVRSISHAGRAETAAALLRKLPGVVDAAVTVEGIARVEYRSAVTDPAELWAAATAAGVELEPDGARTRAVGTEPAISDQRPTAEQPSAADDHRHDGDSEDEGGHRHDGGGLELTVAVAAFAVYLVARVLDWTTDIDAPVTWMYVAAAAVTAVTVGRDVLAAVRARRFDIELLMWVAAAGAASLGHWSDAALLLVLFSLGHGLEGYAMGRARRAIEALGELAPSTARRRRGDTIEDVAVDDLVVGDIMVVRPNERLAADGVVVAGTSSIDESAVTGESVPVDKQPAPAPDDAVAFDELPAQHRVFSGTLNGAGAIEVRLLRPANDSTLARVVQLVAEADSQISPTQALTERIVRVFVPSVLALVAGLLIVPPLLGEPFTESFMRAMAVLVAASPCALAIATPSAVLAAIAAAARSGVLVKGGGPLELLGRIRTVAFDKTGTLTEGRPQLVAVEPTDGTDERELLAVALAIESHSDHPLARAITAGARQRIADLDELAASDVQAVVGKGVTGSVDGDVVMIGNAALFDQITIPDELTDRRTQLEQGGSTTMMIRRGERFLGVIGVMDTPRPEAAAAIQQLSQLGIQRAVMLSGDQQRVADAVAGSVGIDEARGQLLPEDKVTAVKQLAADDRAGVAMVGDGVNDAPALATATVGIAMGAAGSDVALETADIALMADRLDRLPLAVGLARRASRVIRQNLVFSLGVVAVLIPLTIAGVGIGPAVIAHEGSTLVVVANALALLTYGTTKATRTR